MSEVNSPMQSPNEWKLLSKLKNPTSDQAWLYELNEDSTKGKFPDDPVAEKNNFKDLCRFSEIGIVFHCIFWPRNGSEWPLSKRAFNESDDILEPIERDIIAYSQRDLNNRPLHSMVLDSTQIELSFPNEINYSGEGEKYLIKFPKRDQPIRCILTRCFTQFKNGAIVFHLGIKPLQLPLLEKAKSKRKAAFDCLSKLEPAKDGLKELDGIRFIKLLDDLKDTVNKLDEARGELSEYAESIKDKGQQRDQEEVVKLLKNIEEAEAEVEEKARNVIRKIKKTFQYYQKKTLELSKKLNEEGGANSQQIIEKNDQYLRRRDFFEKLVAVIDADALNEFEITMLVKMWEGGEGYDPCEPNSARFCRMKIDEVVGDRIHDDKPSIDIKELIDSEFKKFLVKEFEQSKFGKKAPRKFKVVIPKPEFKNKDEMPDEEQHDHRLYLIGGTIETLHAESLNFLKRYLKFIRRIDSGYSMDYLKEDAERIREHHSAPIPEYRVRLPNMPSFKQRKKVGLALSAIGTGLFDVQNLDKDEMMDSLRNFVVDSPKRAFLVNKGTLFSVETEERLFDVHGDDMGCSPYGLLPKSCSM
jgi:hypothetical protein